MVFQDVFQYLPSFCWAGIAARSQQENAAKLR